ncbi:hypothetical protein EV360DRAFT_69461 [Lentinula raphanica]|nr:hypothetical protein EV360DRAFT_69461 [Lentinula raphanica]
MTRPRVSFPMDTIADDPALFPDVRWMREQEREGENQRMHFIMINGKGLNWLGPLSFCTLLDTFSLPNVEFLEHCPPNSDSNLLEISSSHPIGSSTTNGGQGQGKTWMNFEHGCQDRALSTHVPDVPPAHGRSRRSLSICYLINGSSLFEFNGFDKEVIATNETWALAIRESVKISLFEAQMHAFARTLEPKTSTSPSRRIASFNQKVKASFSLKVEGLSTEAVIVFGESKQIDVRKD